MVGLIAVAPWPGRLWLEDRWKAIVGLLASEGWSCVGLCGPGQRDLCVKMLGETPIRVLGSVEEWRDAFSELAVVITLDSGPMHFADALGVPVVALFGPGQLPKWSPSHPLSQVVHYQNDPDFQPIHQIDANIRKGEKWMRKISVDDVMAAFFTISSRLPAKSSGEVDAIPPEQTNL
jgi:ADP-heptose:LPS heptosyltransferase